MGDTDGAAMHPTPGDTDAPAVRDWPERRERALRLWIALARCYATYARAVSSKVQEYGLTTPQFGILEALYHLGPLSLGELADKLLVTGGNVTYVMDRLEEQGLVYRDRSPDDRRVIQAKLTAKGRDLIARVFPGHGEYIEALSSHLSGGEQDSLRGLLKKLGTAIREEDLK
jgi:MarR family 2-MHQ and catechol resistance regulon transcriptional repressor